MENEVTCKLSLSEVKLLQTLLSGHQIASCIRTWLETVERLFCSNDSKKLVGACDI